MARYNTVNIGSYYFTKDGTISGKSCRLNVIGLDGLLLDKTGKNDFDAEGNAYVMLVDVGAMPIRVEIEYILESVFDSLVSAIQAALTAGTTLSLGVSGDLGTFSLTVLPKFPKPVSASGKFDNGRIDGVAFEFYTT